MSKKTESLVVKATELSRHIKEATEELELLKVKLREAAFDSGLGTSCTNVDFSSSEGVCKVVYVKEKLVLANPKAAEHIYSRLPENLARKVFTVKTVYSLAEDIETVIQYASEADKEELKGIIEYKATEARVNLPK